MSASSMSSLPGATGGSGEANGAYVPAIPPRNPNAPGSLQNPTRMGTKRTSMSGLLPTRKGSRDSNIFPELGDSSLQYIEASVYTREAVHGRDFSKITSESKFTFDIYRAVHSGKYRLCYVILVLALMLLGIWERPSSFSNYANVSRSQFLIVNTVELVIILALTADVYLFWQHLGTKIFVRSKWLLFKLFFVTLAFLTTLACFIQPDTPKIHRLLRPILLLAHLRNARAVATGMLKSVPGILKVAMLLGFLTCFFAIVAIVLFRGNTYGPQGLHDGGDDRYGTSDPGVCNYEFNLTDAWPLTYCSTWMQQSAAAQYHAENKVDCVNNYNAELCGHQCTDYFNSIPEAIMKLLIVITTANFPDIMLPAFNCEPWGTAIFFILFLVFGLIFVTNLVLAVAYHRFQTLSTKVLEKSMKHRIELLNKAFELLIDLQRQHPSSLRNSITTDGDSQLASPAWSETELKNREVWRNFIWALRQDLCKRDRLRIEHLTWQCLSRDNGAVRLSDFLEITTFMELKIRGPDDNKKVLSPIQKQIKVWRGKARSVLQFGCFVGGEQGISLTVEGFWDICVWLNTALIIAALYVKPLHGTVQNNIEQILFALLVIFWVEVASKIFANTFIGYWKERAMNKVDFMICIASLAVEIYQWSADTGNGQNLGSITLLLRSVRLVRALRSLKPFRIVVMTFSTVASNIGEYCVVTLVVYYIAAMIGMDIFAGNIDYGLMTRETNQYLGFANETKTSDFCARPILAVGSQVTWPSDSKFSPSYFNFTDPDSDSTVAAKAYCLMAAKQVVSRTLRGPVQSVHSFQGPSGCYIENNIVYFNEHSSNVHCSPTQQCLCGEEVKCLDPSLRSETYSETISDYQRLVRDSTDGIAARFNQAMCSAYGKYHYWDLNFNSLANTFVVLFYLMIVNNWVIIMEGYVAVNSVWARCYFVAWFLVIVFVVLNVVTAFLLDFFTKQEEENKKHDAGYIPEWHDRIIKAAVQLEQVKIQLPFANEREPPANELFKGFSQRVKDWIIVRPSHTMDKTERMYGEDVIDDLQAQFNAVGDIFSVHNLVKCAAVKRAEDADIVSGTSTKRKGSKKYDNLDSDEQPNGIVTGDDEDDLG